MCNESRKMQATLKENLKKERKSIEHKASIAFEECMQNKVFDKKEIVKYVGEAIGKKDYRAIIPYILKSKKYGWTDLQLFIDEQKTKIIII